MRNWTPAIPIAGSFALSAGIFSRLANVGHPDFSPLIPVSFAGGDGVPRLGVALLLPTVALGVWILLSAVAKVVGPRKPLPEWWLNEETGSESVQRFAPTYSTITFTVASLFALMHVALVAGVLHWPPWTYKMLTAILGVGFIAAGNIMPRTRPNWIVGLRTKRTLTDRAAWQRTHRVLGALMMGLGAVVVGASILAPRYALSVAVLGLLQSFIIAHAFGTRDTDTVLLERT
ncbi:MAG TPA: SdpI family protein [Gemmatimonadaceae bacterium]|nr:SdpI family protein [Gemmatimonadaceae bacterium]